MKNLRVKFPAVFFVLFSLVVLSCPGCWEDGGDEADENGAPADDPALSLAADLADTWIRSFSPGQNAWSWDAGVMMMGLVELADATGEEAYADYARAWIDYHIWNGYRIFSSDSCIPGFTALRLFERTGEEIYLSVADDVWHYIRNVAGRTSDGGLNHMGWLTGNQIWIDSLFMIGPFLLEYAAVRGDDAPYEELALQLEVFRKRLRSRGTGLYRHRYDDDTGEVAPEEPIFWARGNGWVFAAHNLAYRGLPRAIIDGLSFDLREDIETMLRGILYLEDESGRFHTVLNRPETYLETSAGILYAYGLLAGTRGDRRIFPDTGIEDAERWLQGAIDQIVVDEAGDTLLLGTSYGTSPGDVTYYEEVLKGENVAYGLGLFLLAACEREKVGRRAVLDEPPGTSDEVYIHPPQPCEGAACGKFYIARGNFDRAGEALDAAIAAEGGDAHAVFFRGIIDLVRFGVEAMAWIDRLSLGDATVDDLFDWLAGDGGENLRGICLGMEEVQQDPEFSSVLERLLIIEGGGHSAIGRREFDVGEAFFVDALARLLIGAAELYPVADKGGKDLLKIDREALEAGLGQIVVGLEKAIAGIEAVIAETDDQSDDLLPRNLFFLSGTFGIPGLLPETPVEELLNELGLAGRLLAGLDMPYDLIELLESLKRSLEFVLGIL